jgi:glycosyltransferase involved in cell wall biosynthesis
MKVAHVIARLNVGGTARYLGDLLPKLEESNIDCQLFTGHVQGREVEDSCLGKLKFNRVENLGRKISLTKDFKAFIELRKELLEYKPDVIHSHTFKAGLLSRLMLFNVPKVHTFHGHLLADPEFNGLKKRAIIFLESLLARRTRRLIVTGERVATDLVNAKIGRTYQYCSIPGELSDMKFLPRIEARENLKLGNEFVVLWMARFAQVKQPYLLVKIALLCPDYTFLMCGDGELLDEIVELAPSNLILPGMVNAEKILLAADVFVSTSANEGIPYSLLEAQLAGLPIIAIDSGAISEILENNVDGFLVEESEEVIASLLKLLGENNSMRAAMGRNAKIRAESRNSNHRSARKHFELYSMVISALGERPIKRV